MSRTSEWVTRQAPEKIREQRVAAYSRRMAKLKEDPEAARVHKEKARLAERRRAEVLSKDPTARTARARKQAEWKFAAAKDPLRWRKYRLSAVRRKAELEGREFNLELSDIPLPEVCPYMGIRLVYGVSRGRATPDSASIDRKDSSKGYVKGNVLTVCYRANVLKNDALCAEVERLAAGMRREGCP